MDRFRDYLVLAVVVAWFVSGVWFLALGEVGTGLFNTIVPAALVLVGRGRLLFIERWAKSNDE